MSLPETAASLSRLRAHQTDCYREGGGTRPDVLVIETRSGKAVLKDFNRCDRAFSLLVGRMLAGREARALSRLRDIPEVPDLLARPDPRSLLMAKLEAVSHRRVDPQFTDWPAYFQQLSLVVDRMHALGVAHCDMRSPHNVLMDQRGSPVLVDFVASYCRGARWNILSQWLFRQFCRADNLALVKLKSRMMPDGVSEEEKQLLSNPGVLDRWARRFGHGVRDISRMLLIRKNTATKSRQE